MKRILPGPSPEVIERLRAQVAEREKVPVEVVKFRSLSGGIADFWILTPGRPYYAALHGVRSF